MLRLQHVLSLLPPHLQMQPMKFVSLPRVMIVAVVPSLVLQAVPMASAVLQQGGVAAQVTIAMASRFASVVPQRAKRAAQRPGMTTAVALRGAMLAVILATAAARLAGVALPNSTVMWKQGNVL